MNPVVKIIIVVIVPLLFALGVRFLFGVADQLFVIMSVSFIFLVPFGIGALTIYLSPVKYVRSLQYRVTMPWAPLAAFLLITLCLGIEGWACWLMVMPIFMLAATAGGLVAGRYKLRNDDNERIYVSVLMLLPFLISPLEQWIGSHPKIYEAYTYIDLQASKETIWKNVTSVRAIAQNQDRGWLTRTLGFPRPVRAELNYNGVGGYRKAIFDKGLVFHETVLEYEDQHRMRFSIKANPYEIPSTTMDKHVVIGGEYFNVLDGTYVLQKLNTTTYRLHLYSHFQLTTTFNFYASLWASWIMRDIQNNILQVIKERVE